MEKNGLVCKRLVFTDLGGSMFDGSLTQGCDIVDVVAEEETALAAGLPPDDWWRRNPEFREPNLSRNLALVERLRSVGKRHGRSAGEVAIAGTLRNPLVITAIVGARTASQAEGVLGAADLRLSEDDIFEIEGNR